MQICPICAAVPSGEPNHQTDDIPAHIAFDHHRGGSGSGGGRGAPGIDLDDASGGPGKNCIIFVKHKFKISLDYIATNL